MKYAIGQEVWLAHFESREKHITCDDCGGTKSLRVTLFDGTGYAIECEGCQRGYLGPAGYNVVHERAACAVPAVILGMEVKGEGIAYKTNQAWHVPEADVFLTEAEALARASVIATEQNAADLDRLRSKEKPAKSWAWHVTYHRRCIREAERQLAYHESKLGIAKEKAKKEAGR